YDSSVKLFRQLTERGLVPLTEEWNKEIEETIERQKQAMKPRLFPKIPASRYLCFYPMDRRRGEDKNWYMLPIEERGRQMEEHGMVGRRSAGVQEADLRDALRPGQRGVRRVRTVLRGTAGSAGEAD